MTQEEPCASTLERKPRKPFGLGQPCEDDSVDSDAYTKELITAIEEARAEIARGEFFTLEEFEKEIDSWITK